MTYQTCLVASLVVLCVVVFLWQSRNIWRSAAKISAFRLERTAILQREIDGLRQHLNESIRESDRVAKRNGDLQTKIAGLEQKLLKPDNDEQSVSDLAKLVYQGWHRCNEAASGRFRGHYSKPFVAADGEYELIYRRRGSPELADWRG